MMFSLLSWILICAAFCILSSTSSNAGVSDPLVSLTCNKTVDVEAGKHLTLNCTIQLPLGEDCLGDDYIWEDSNNNIICDRITSRTVNYTCKWDGETYVSLVIREVAENLTYTVVISTSCGNSDSYITVKVRQNHGLTNGFNPPQAFPTVTVIGSIFSIVLVLGILSALFTTKRGKERLKCVKRGKNPEYTDASQACLVNSGV